MRSNCFLKEWQITSTLISVLEEFDLGLHFLLKLLSLSEYLYQKSEYNKQRLISLRIRMVW